MYIRKNILCEILLNHILKKKRVFSHNNFKKDHDVLCKLLIYDIMLCIQLVP